MSSDQGDRDKDGEIVWVDTKGRAWMPPVKLETIKLEIKNYQENIKMKDEQILRKAIKKALKAGWEVPVKSVAIGRDYKNSEEHLAKSSNKKDVDLIVGEFLREPTRLFNHAFAFYLWGGKVIKINDKDMMVAYGHHLQQMVVCENPIDYIKKHLK